MMAGDDVASLAQRLRGAFETPRTFDGVTILAEPVDAEAARPKFVLRGYMSNNEVIA